MGRNIGVNQADSIPTSVEDPAAHFSRQRDIDEVVDITLPFVWHDYQMLVCRYSSTKMSMTN